MRKHLTLLLVLIVVAVGILYALNKTNGAPNRVKNGFVRNFDGTTATLIKEADFGWHFREVCGQQGDSLFLMGTDPTKIFMTNTNLSKLDTFNLDIPPIKRLAPAFRCNVIFPYAYIVSSNAQRIIKADLITGKSEVRVLPFHGVFHNSVMLDSNRFVIRYIDTTTLNAKFKLMDGKGNILITEGNLSKPMQDAGFLYAGSLNYDKQSDKLVFATSYVNELTCFDTMMKLNYNTQTIDTTHTLKTEIVHTKRGVTFKKPPISINGHATIYNKTLYLRSKLMADNEHNNDFDKNIVIDRYKIEDGHYLGSFYLPSLKGKDVLQYYFIGSNRILGLSNDKIGVFNLTQP
ncbi:MAG: hypothetical protein J0I32_20070 [Sphingobacteriales bacterium]|nr:hypothetical protein [Sphingobacteriales bacterium]OJV98805.1 MAG: hypothetical protein BGO52_08530 [Sphingobacteriales bacterium 44-61]